MFEPQDHPNDMDERGIPRRPYDSAGWTLAYQMGVKFDRVFDDVTGAFKEIAGPGDAGARHDHRHRERPATCSRRRSTTPSPSPTAC